MRGDIQSRIAGLPRCGAKTRVGALCQRVKAKGKPRCFLHGGANGSGAPKGNRNALKHGVYTVENRALYRRLARLYREMRDGLRV